MTQDNPFRRDGVRCIRGFLKPSLLEQISVFLETAVTQGFAHPDRQVPCAPALYGAPLLERLLEELTPLVSKIVGREVLPTCSYGRVYGFGDQLIRHVDRPACEVSASLAVEQTPISHWPLWVQGNEGPQSFAMLPGDALFYEGSRYHWRDPFDGKSAKQVFLHYVYSDGEYKEWVFDKRGKLNTGR